MIIQATIEAITPMPSERRVSTTQRIRIRFGSVSVLADPAADAGKEPFRFER